jgi:ABC transporter DrrB family efflux protein
MLTAPVSRMAILLGKIASDSTRMMFQVIIIVGVSYLFGFRMTTGPAGLLLTLAVAAGFGVAWAGLSNMVALATRNSEATMMFGILFTFPVLFMSNAMMPEFFLPDWLKTVARFNPASHVIDAVRALANAGFDWALVGKAFGIMAIVAAITFSGALRLFRRVSV